MLVGRGRKRTMKGKGITSFLKGAYNKGKAIYDKVKSLKPATKAL